MRYRGLWATILALFVLLLWAPAASADILDLSNGIRIPKDKDINTPWGTFPTDAELTASGRNNLKLSYEAFELGGVKGPAGQVASLYITTAITKSVEFSSGEQNGVRGYWAEAAEAFKQAAENLSGVAKEVALYKAMLATANTGNAPATLRAADALLAADPKTYYFGPAQETRARVFAQAGRLGDAVAALKAVTDAPRMNVRDYFSAAYLSAWLTKFIRASTAEAYTDAEKEFNRLLKELDRHPQKELASVPRLRILMSLGACVRALGRSEEAKGIYAQILKAATDTTDKAVLAGVYYGLGDVAFEEASALQSRAKGAPELKEQVQDMLDQAALHYLRVLLLYKDFADQNQTFGATQGAARVFATLFTITGEKDCETARRSYDFYRQAVELQPQGEARRLLVREGKALKKRMDEICKDDAEEPVPGIPDEEEEDK
jgi:tetratricopeptide (TPR) repeat protein